jgi:hypothetical protein
MTQHEQYMQQQDQVLEDMGAVVDRLTHMGRQIGDELDSQIVYVFIFHPFFVSSLSSLVISHVYTFLLHTIADLIPPHPTPNTHTIMSSPCPLLLSLSFACVRACVSLFVYAAIIGRSEIEELTEHAAEVSDVFDVQLRKIDALLKKSGKSYCWIITVLSLIVFFLFLLLIYW